MSSIFHFKNFNQPISNKDAGHQFSDSMTGRNLFVSNQVERECWKLALDELKPHSGNFPSLLHKINQLLFPERTSFSSKPEPSWVAFLPSKQLSSARIADRAALFASAACCLADTHEHAVLERLRFFALIDEFEKDIAAQLLEWATKLGVSLPENETSNFETARILASTPLSWDSKKWAATGAQHKIDAKADFAAHPLAKSQKRISLIMGGAQHVKSYFFESGRLPEIRGASSLLDLANRSSLSKVFGQNGIFPVPEAVVFEGGGTFLAFAPDSLANKIADAIEREYALLTLTAQSAVAASDFRPVELHYGLAPEKRYVFSQKATRESKGFGELCNYMAGLVQERRSGSPQAGRSPLSLPAQPEASPLFERCSSCGLRPVSAFPAALDAEEEAPGLCESCARKALMGRYTKSEKVGKQYESVVKQIGWTPVELDISTWPDEYSAFLEQDQGLLQSYLEKSAINTLDKLQSARSLIEIAGSSSSVAMIYADGNNISAALEEIKSPAQYRQFSSRLFSTCREAVFSSLAKQLSPIQAEDFAGGYSWIHPFEILSIGGDDLIVIVPAARAIDIAIEIADCFEKLWDSNPGTQNSSRFEGSIYLGKQSRSFAAAPKITLSLGVVIADASTPIIHLRELAEELLKSAKKKSRKLAAQKKNASVIDFQSLKSTGNLIGGLEQFRQSNMEKTIQPAGNEKPYVLRFTARPYLLNELHALSQTIGDFHAGAIPRSQLYSLRSTLLTSKMKSRLEYLYMKKRATGATATMFQHLDENWHKADYAPWIKSSEKSESDVFESVLADIIELMPYHSEEKEPAHAN